MILLLSPAIHLSGISLNLAAINVPAMQPLVSASPPSFIIVRSPLSKLSE